MLRELRERWPSGPAEPPRPELIVGDAVHPPFARGSFDLIAAMGNLLGFAADDAHGDAKAWQHLLDGEETLGRTPERWPSAAAVLLAAVAPD